MKNLIKGVLPILTGLTLAVSVNAQSLVITTNVHKQIVKHVDQIVGTKRTTTTYTTNIINPVVLVKPISISWASFDAAVAMAEAQGISAAKAVSSTNTSNFALDWLPKLGLYRFTANAYAPTNPAAALTPTSQTILLTPESVAGFISYFIGAGYSSSVVITTNNLGGCYGVNMPATNNVGTNVFVVTLRLK